MSARTDAPCCGHAVDEHSVYGCVDGCACEKRPDLPTPPTDGPKTYRGIPVPESLHHNWDQPEAHWWRQGVRTTLVVAGALVGSLHYDSACSLDHHGYCQEHGHLSDGPCPDGEAQKFLAAMKEGGPSDE